jgi:cell division septum initiation protein DivIVA
MPDQHTAAQEHALIREVIEPLSTLPDDPVGIAAAADFPITLRGYDRVAVDAYVRSTSQLVAELQATRSPEAAVRRALERVGEQIAGILQRAHETAEQITAQSRAEAEERLEAARREAHQIIAGAAHRVQSLDTETDRIWTERHRIVSDVQELADRLAALAENALERFPADEGVVERIPAEEGVVERATDAESVEVANAHEAADPKPEPEPTAILRERP